MRARSGHGISASNSVGSQARYASARATMPAVTRPTVSRARQRPDTPLPTPANTRKALSTTATAYRGWLRNRMNFWMKAISMHMKATPMAAK